MSGVKLCFLPDSQLLRVKALYNTCQRMDSLMVTYYERGEISLETTKVCRFDNALALKKIEELEKIFDRLEKNLGAPEKISSRKESEESDE